MVGPRVPRQRFGPFKNGFRFRLLCAAMMLGGGLSHSIEGAALSEHPVFPGTTIMAERLRLITEQANPEKHPYLNEQLVEMY